jgi:hypothetical protein
MDFLRQMFFYAVLIAMFWGTVILVPKLSRFQVPSGYSDVYNLTEYKSYRVDRTISLSRLQPDDAVCFRVGKTPETEINFGWIAALPGDEVEVKAGELLVNGKACKRGGNIILPDCGPLRIPANHFFVVTDCHQYDSVARGPLPAIALYGRVGDFP